MVTPYNYKYTEEENRDTKRFQQRFEAHITESREYRHSVREPMDYRYATAASVYEMNYKVEPCVAIHLPRLAFDRLMDDQSRMDSWREEAEYAKKVLTNLRKDEVVRDENPAVAKAYRNYITLLEIARR
jgi:hypothetical protein